MGKETGLQKLKDFFKTKLSAEEQKALKDFTTVKMAEVKTNDGKVFTYEGETMQNATINEITATGLSPVADGSYTLEDGTIITVAAGKVSEVKAKETPTEDETPVTMAMLTKAFADYEGKQTAKLEAANALNAKLSSDIVLLKKTVNEILETEISTASTEKTNVKLSAEEIAKLSPKEKYLYTRGKL